MLKIHQMQAKTIKTTPWMDIQMRLGKSYLKGEDHSTLLLPRLRREETSGDQLRHPVFTWAKYKDQTCSLLLLSEGLCHNLFSPLFRCTTSGGSREGTVPTICLVLSFPLPFPIGPIFPYHFPALNPTSGPRLTVPLISRGDGGSGLKSSPDLL